MRPLRRSSPRPWRRSAPGGRAGTRGNRVGRKRDGRPLNEHDASPVAVGFQRGTGCIAQPNASNSSDSKRGTNMKAPMILPAGVRAAGAHPKLDDLPDEDDFCRNCGAALPHDVMYGWRKFCTNKCRNAWHYRQSPDAFRVPRHGERKCRQCDARFAAFTSKQKYCSLPCYHRSLLGRRPACSVSASSHPGPDRGVHYVGCGE
jgi:hypothetical protein